MAVTRDHLSGNRFNFETHRLCDVGLDGRVDIGKRADRTGNGAGCNFLRDFLAAYNHFKPEAQITLDMPEDPIVAGIDRVLMRRVLHNLVTNAIQAAGPGQAELRISCFVSPNDRIHLRVEDNGPGVPDHDADKVFEPYFTTKNTGTGLGLAIVKKIVLQHQGSIVLARAPDGGASFLITLPAAPANTKPNAADSKA